MKNLITGVLLLGAAFWIAFWGIGSGTPEAKREVVSIESSAMIQEAAIHFEFSPPKARAVGGEGAPAPDSNAYAGLSPSEAAKAYFEANRGQWNIQSHHDSSFVVTQNPLGATARIQFSQDGVPITGMYISMDLGKNNEIRSVQNMYRPLERADLNAPMLSAEEASQRLSQRYEGARETESSVLLFASAQNIRPEPAYSVSAVEVANDGQTHRPVKLVVRASDGQVLDISYERVEFQ